jgi:hypothetical protein
MQRIISVYPRTHNRGSSARNGYYKPKESFHYTSRGRRDTDQPIKRWGVTATIIRMSHG